ncbi:MAG: sigma-70 family RNA polymerase sigma factor [Candidatus Poribacteria bacterium]|nr:sigma-70 family RNA polymerase sigma factor [Candidatus Poribacteria bacterium]
MKSDIIGLIQRTLAGDEAAFASLVGKYQKQVHTYAWRWTGDFHIAEDITQDTFLQVHQKLETLEDPRQFTRWLYAIVDRFCIAWYRKNRLRPESMEEIHISKIETDTYSRYIASEYAKVTTDAQRDLVKKLLAKLKERDKEIITLHYFDEMTSAEISAYLGIPENTTKSRLHRARQQLKKYGFMVQEELDITIETEHHSQRQLKGEISMTDEGRNESEVNIQLADIQRQITDLQEQVNTLGTNLDISVDSHKRKIINTLFQLHHGAKDPITWCSAGAYHTASGQKSSRGSIWTTSIDEFLSKAPDTAIANLANIFTDTTVVAILRQLVEEKRSVEELAKGCDTSESEIEKAVKTLIEAKLASRTKDNFIVPENDAVFYFLNFVGMTRVHLDPKDH